MVDCAAKLESEAFAIQLATSFFSASDDSLWLSLIWVPETSSRTLSGRLAYEESLDIILTSLGVVICRAEILVGRRINRCMLCFATLDSRHESLTAIDRHFVLF